MNAVVFAYLFLHNQLAKVIFIIRTQTIPIDFYDLRKLVLVSEQNYFLPLPFYLLLQIQIYLPINSIASLVIKHLHQKTNKHQFTVKFKIQYLTHKIQTSFQQIFRIILHTINFITKTMKKTNKTFIEKPQNTNRTKTHKLSTTKKSASQNNKSAMNRSHMPFSPISTPTRTVKHSTPLVQIHQSQTSFNRLICKQPTPKQSPEKQQVKFNQNMRQLLSRSSAFGKESNMELIKEFICESNKLFYEQIRKENKKMKARLKDEIYEYIQEIKKEIFQNLKHQVNKNQQQKIQRIVRSRFNSFSDQKLKISSPQILQLNSKDMKITRRIKGVEQQIQQMNNRIEEYSNFVKIDFFQAFSGKLSEVIEKYNQNFTTVNTSVDGLQGLVRQVIFIMREVAEARKRRNTQQQCSPMNKTAKFSSIDT